MNRKIKCIACCGTAALALLVAVSAPHIRQEPTVLPYVRPVAAFVREDRVIQPPEPPPTVVGEEPANVEPDSSLPVEIAFEAPKASDRPAILISKEPPRDKPTLEPIPLKNTETATAIEPKWATLES